MKNLSTEIRNLKKSEVGEKVQKRIEEFEEVGKKGNKRWFSELSFCVLTANFTAEGGIEIQNELGPDGFIDLPQTALKEKLEELGHRFYRSRAEYIVENRKYSHNIKDIVKQFSDPRETRKWLAGNVKGIGFKEGSHFLRNVGYKNIMILDRHILRVLDKRQIIDQIPKTLTKNRYLNIEKKTEDLAEKSNTSLAELDLYIWYMDTGQILK